MVFLKVSNRRILIWVSMRKASLNGQCGMRLIRSCLVMASLWRILSLIYRLGFDRCLFAIFIFGLVFYTIIGSFHHNNLRVILLIFCFIF